MEVRFDKAFQGQFLDLLKWRRDVRHFRTDPVDEGLLAHCLDTIRLAPSVGLSEPWRLIRVNSPEPRAAAIANFKDTNAKALAGLAGDRAALYSGLKLSGMQNAPVHLAVFSETGTEKGSHLGATTMPEMRDYSVVAAVTQMWLMLRAHGLGLGWVSILDPARLAADLGVTQDWKLIGYFCIGWPEEDSEEPELMRENWEARSRTLEMEVL
ncbi:5,6-dimethylbenzimidazole synthase [Alphaproteobacteria bacterium KMM 3653]|uniref:5,6-dimethylbenzimidazole synthase n=1 Tax=Harenicola maris TaxID=2841044 RepID=A0AAP2CRQ6_9RHOB|nr:5,6-dimethylbenzimidazole synthase [Harenicola maris]